MKKVFASFVLLSLFLASSIFSQAQRVKKQLPFSKGINLTSWMEYGRFNTLMYGKEDFENIKSLGVEVARIPIWFDIWTDNSTDCNVDSECFAILDRAIKWCEELGLYVIIDFHNDTSGSSKTDPKIEKALLKIWPQVAERYKNRGSRIIYEVMNEPHFSSGNLQTDLSRWGKIQGNVIDAIRQVDKNHYIIVGGGDFNSPESMLALPNYNDDKLIYNFHDYSPFLFTHQGASWTYAKRFKKIPFPYSKERMPALPPNPTAAEKWEHSNYKNNSSEKALTEFLDKAVEFANKRNSALMCNEYGVLMTYANPEDRALWYKMKAKWLDERGIARLSWDYTKEFGLFNSPNEGRFPEDLNKRLLLAMGYKMPAKTKGESWFERGQAAGNWTIYKDGSAPLLSIQSYSKYGSLFAGSDEKYINLVDLKEYDELIFGFKEACDFTKLKNGAAKLEFYAKTYDKGFDLTVYLRDMASKIFPWRAAILVGTGEVKPDGEWHKVSIPLANMNDIGGWTEESDWRVSEGAFSWALIDALVFENNNHKSKVGYCLKDIKIVP